MRSKKYTLKILDSTSLFYCSKKCEQSIFPFNLVRDKEYIKINANEIKEPCTKCGGECHRFDIIQCDECDKWTHQVCTSLTKQQFKDIGNSSDLFYCSKKCELKVFPFNNLSNGKFFDLKKQELKTLDQKNESELKEVGIRSTEPEHTDIAESSPKIECNYLDNDQIHELGLLHGLKDLFLFHTNVASLNKNQGKIEELFMDQQKMPDIIGVTETKLTVNKDIPNNIGLKNYNFEHCPTMLASGGAGIFIANNLEYEIRNDLQLHIERCEDIWVNVNLKKYSKKCTENNLVVGVIYRHPGSQITEFENKICSIVNALNQTKTNFVILGDVNINLLKVNLVQSISNYNNNIQSS